MRATTHYVTKIFQNRVEILAEGTVSTRPRFSYNQKIVLEGRNCPEFAFKHPVPEYYTWDHSGEAETTQRIVVDTVISRPFNEFPEEIHIEVNQWAKKGHVWREFSINGTAATQEIWYKEDWDHGTLYKSMWIEWNRGEAREEVHVEEADGMRERYFFRRAKAILGPPGFFWYKGGKGNVSEHWAAKIWRFALSPELFKMGTTLSFVGQDFGYDRWPSNLWLKMVYEREGGIYWQAKETVEEKGDHAEIRGEITVEEKGLKI
ncbi:MAG: hypothetical protein PWP76_276 [Candidatus Diapherotrites archaeon]|nr:hypothetical protein [Candidatus Diapherotrites archaeon]MDN5366745.1 hypothetical protein [Candidatus Diapherotrites archaeon]